jgi:hypothetical protein
MFAVRHGLDWRISRQPTSAGLLELLDFASFKINKPKGDWRAWSRGVREELVV